LNLHQLDFVPQYQEKHGIWYLDPNPDGFPIVLLLHGLGVDGSSWAYQLLSLTQAGLRPIAPDLPGFGRSSASNNRWNISDCAKQMGEFLDDLEIAKAVVVGISLGGTVALMLALHKPDRIFHLVLINTFACLRPRRVSELAYLAGRFLIANLRGVEYQAAMVAQRLFPEPEKKLLRRALIERILQSDKKIYRSAMRSLALFDVRRRLKDLQVSTTIITAENDTTVSPSIQRELAARIRNANQVIVSNSGHAAIIDQPEQINQILINLSQNN